MQCEQRVQTKRLFERIRGSNLRLPEVEYKIAEEPRTQPHERGYYLVFVYDGVFAVVGNTNWTAVSAITMFTSKPQFSNRLSLQRYPIQFMIATIRAISLKVCRSRRSCCVATSDLLGPTRSYSVLLGPTRSYSVLLGPTRSYSVLLGPTRSYSVLLGPTRSYSVLLGPTRSYSVLHPDTPCLHSFTPSHIHPSLPPSLLSLPFHTTISSFLLQPYTTAFYSPFTFAASPIMFSPALSTPIFHSCRIFYPSFYFTPLILLLHRAPPSFPSPDPSLLPPSSFLS